ncbi:MAG: CAP domain-containing protein [Synergistaceae bacterium]|nr:CAP domain-containing protein [Synergistaceae bacterium]
MRLKIFPAVLVVVFMLSSSAYADSIYDSEPTFSPYYAGSVKSAVLNEALQELNYIRWLIGVPNNVTLNAEYTRKAQHGAVLLDAVGTLTHTPSRPSDMSQSFYELGYDATTHSNLSWGSSEMTLKLSTKLCMHDSDSSNISRLGHRRWLMNPRLKQTGFGISTRGGFAATYVIEEFEHSGEGNTLTQEEYERYLEWLKWPVSDEFITWPTGRHPHPLTYFEADTAWSVTLNRDVFDDTDASSVKVVLTRNSDGRTWKFSRSSSDGYFAVSKGEVAYDQCIIFRPDGITSYNNGETWSVEVSGLARKDGGTGSISYRVTFTGETTGYEEDTPYNRQGSEDSDEGGCGVMTFPAFMALLVFGIPRIRK